MDCLPPNPEELHYAQGYVIVCEANSEEAVKKELMKMRLSSCGIFKEQGVEKYRLLCTDKAEVVKPGVYN
jgi:hypothetical protein